MIRYTANQLAALTDEVEHQRGAILPDVCIGQEVDYRFKARRFPLRTHECRNRSRFVVRYDCDDDVANRGGGFATACAIGDNMGEWPRFKAAVSAA